MKWHGYTQAKSAVEGRPWWTMEFSPDGVRVLCVRSDGRRRSVDDYDELDTFDCENPLPAPEPAAGQVWVNPATRVSKVVIHVVPKDDGWEVTTGAGIAFIPKHLWPVDGLVIVAGEGAPWANMEKP